MVIGDWDTKENRQYKERLSALRDEDRLILGGIDDEAERSDFLRMTDANLDWNSRYVAGTRLSSATLSEIASRNEYTSISKVILKERGL